MLSRLITSFFILWLAMPFASIAQQNVLVFGDSLSAGYGIAVSQSWPALLDKRIAELKLPYKVFNASISGETTAGGRARLADALKRNQPGIVLIALGANDGLRGLPNAQMRDNLTAMVRVAKNASAKVLLIGMRIPPNYGPAYARQFEQTFSDIAQAEGVALLPFLLEPIALDGNAFQSDGLHPTATAQARLLDHVWPAVRPLLK